MALLVHDSEEYNSSDDDSVLGGVFFDDASDLLDPDNDVIELDADAMLGDNSPKYPPNCVMLANTDAGPSFSALTFRLVRAASVPCEYRQKLISTQNAACAAIQPHVPVPS
jgi:hypothetical protein